MPAVRPSLRKPIARKSFAYSTNGTARASVTFTSTQPGSKGVNAGETCTDWSITYSLVRGSRAGGG